MLPFSWLIFQKKYIISFVCCSAEKRNYIGTYLECLAILIFYKKSVSCISAHQEDVVVKFLLFVIRNYSNMQGAEGLVASLHNALCCVHSCKPALTDYLGNTLIYSYCRTCIYEIFRNNFIEKKIFWAHLNVKKSSFHYTHDFFLPLSFFFFLCGEHLRIKTDTKEVLTVLFWIRQRWSKSFRWKATLLDWFPIFSCRTFFFNNNWENRLVSG